MSPGMYDKQPKEEGARPSSGALAHLARAGYSSLCQPLTAVDFEVHHLRDHAGYLVNLLASGDPGRPRYFLEALSSSANGVGVVIGTRTDAATDNFRIRDHGTSAEPRVQVDIRPERHRFLGTARPSLTFLSESDYRFEFIVSIGDEPGPISMGEAIEIKKLVEKISGIAVARAQAPLLSVVCPAQLPVESDAETDPARIPRSSSTAVRFCIALRQPSASLKFTLADQIIDYCAQKQFRLWFADTRLGHRTGNWFAIRSRSDKDESESESEKRRPAAAYSVLPVTFVGPARVGSTNALFSLLNEFPFVGVIGCTIALLDDLAFVHLQLGFRTRHGNVGSIEATAANNDPTEQMLEILPRIAKEQPPTLDKDVKSKIMERAGDYQTLIGPLLPTVPIRTERRLALWFSWQMTRTEKGLATPMKALRQAFQQIDFATNSERTESAESLPNIEYLICRDLGNSVFRGKGKLSIPLKVAQQNFHGSNVEAAPSQLCVALEDAWKAELDKDPDAASIRDVTIVWREYWLLHWSTTLT